MVSLNVAKLNKNYNIREVKIKDTKLLRRMLELGFTRLERIKILAKSSLKKVCLVEIRGYVVSVKTEILSEIWGEEC